MNDIFSVANCELTEIDNQDGTYVRNSLMFMDDSRIS